MRFMASSRLAGALGTEGHGIASRPSLCTRRTDHVDGLVLVRRTQIKLDGTVRVTRRSGVARQSRVQAEQLAIRGANDGVRISDVEARLRRSRRHGAKWPANRQI